MRIEHIAFNVTNAPAVCEWYIKHLGLRLARQVGPAYFLADDDSRTVVELYTRPDVAPPDYFQTNPMTLHIALQVPESTTVTAERDRLVAAGATVAIDVTPLSCGGQNAILRCPAGIPLQIIQRKAALL
eukprot:m51a1_g4689 hypothetical protein (129) ;mRNA; f:192008-192394